jgi:leucyl aminopeptidase
MPTVSAASSVPKAATAVDLPVASDELEELPEPVRRAAELQGFEAKVGQALVLPSTNGEAMEVLIGLGPRHTVNPGALRLAAAAYARTVARHRTVATTLVDQLDADSRADAVAAVVEGVRLASYRFAAYKEPANLELRRVAVLVKGRGAKSELERAAAVADAVVLARDLSNEPGGSLTPAALTVWSHCTCHTRRSRTLASPPMRSNGVGLPAESGISWRF